jgi:integrase
MGIFERPKGSGVWWILYYDRGVRMREKVGSKSSAKDLYQKRKGDALAGEKMPELRKRRVLLGELIDDAVAAIVRKALGTRDAADLTPQEIGRWLAKQCKTHATYNRYKAFISLCFREGLANGKVKANPARLVRQKKESVGRLRFLSRAEYDKLAAVIEAKYPHHFAEFAISVHTGIRLSEQYTLVWKPGRHDGWIDLERGVIDLSKTKNGMPRIVPLNSVALEAARRQRAAVPANENRCFPRDSKDHNTRHWFNPALEEAGIVGYTWHSNRHTFCSWMAMAGASLKTIQELAGHKTISMSARYSHLSPDHKQSEIERIAAAPAKVKEMPRRKA